MNLLEFAVQRKLEHEDQLLDYVAKRKDVPVDVLSTSLADIIGPLENRRASLLVENYTEMLSEYVPMTYKRDAQTGEYTVEGEIDEVILDSISLVHDIDAESAISDMIEENIRVLTNTPAEVRGLNIGELERVATTLRKQTIQTMSDDSELFDMDEVLSVGRSEESVFEEVLQEAPKPETSTPHKRTIQTMSDDSELFDMDEVLSVGRSEESVFEEVLQEAPKPPVEDVTKQTIQTMSDDELFNVGSSKDSVFEEVLQEAPKPPVEDVVEEVIQEALEPADEDIVEDVVEDVVEDEPEDVVETADLDDVLDDVIDEAIEDETVTEAVSEESVEDEVVPEAVAEEDEEQLVAAKMKRIYTRLVDDIKSAGLDKSLGLVL